MTKAPGGGPAPRLLGLDDLRGHFVGVPASKHEIGPLSVVVQYHPDRGHAVITLLLSGAKVDEKLLMYGNASMAVNVALGAASATGTITMGLVEAPQFSSIIAVLTAIDASGDYPFRGELASWVATGQPVVGDYTLQLNGEISTMTTVRGVDANTAQFNFVVRGTPAGFLTATQFSPVQISKAPIQMGAIKINARFMIDLTIPTSLQRGSLFLAATFKTATTPPTPVASSVANWLLPPAAIAVQIDPEM